MELCREKEISSFTCDIRLHFIYSIFIKLLFRVTVTFFVTVSTLAFNYYPNGVWLFYLKMDLYRFEFYAISIKLPNAVIFDLPFSIFSLYPNVWTWISFHSAFYLCSIQYGFRFILRLIFKILISTREFSSSISSII